MNGIEPSMDTFLLAHMGALVCQRFGAAGSAAKQAVHSLCRGLVAQSCPTLHDPIDCSNTRLLCLHYLSEFAQTHVH